MSNMLPKFYFLSSSVVSRAFSALCAYMRAFDVRHNPHPKATLVPNFVSVAPFIADRAGTRRKIA